MQERCADRFSKAIQEKYELSDWKHATAILMSDFPNEWKDLNDLLENFEIPLEWISEPGGNKSPIAQYVDTFLCQERGWVEKKFETAIVVDGVKRESPTHKVDCYKNRIALELEWNNKDPFFDRDLNNFRLLFDLQVISVGIIITRCDNLQEIFNKIGKGSSYGNSTTHLSKLGYRIQGGGGAGCPLLVIGIKQKCIKGEWENGNN